MTPILTYSFYFYFFRICLFNKGTNKKRSRFYSLDYLLGWLSLQKVRLLLIFLVFFLLFYLKVELVLRIWFIFVKCICVLYFWYGHEIWQSGPWFLIEFLKYQIELFSKPVAGHQQPFYYHFVVLLFGCFPFFAIKNTLFHRKRTQL